MATAELGHHPDGSTWRLVWRNAAGSAVRSHTQISYDLGGLREDETVDVVHPATDSNARPGGQVSYRYDAAARLTRFTRPFGLEGSATGPAVTD